MSEFRARGGGVFFENILSPQEKATAEYRKRVRELEQRVELLEAQMAQLVMILQEVNHG